MSELGRPNRDGNGPDTGRRGCTFRLADGRLCGATRRHSVPFCFLHDPESAEEAAEARRMGGVRRRRERTIVSAYEITGVLTTDEQVRLLEIAVFDALALDASTQRVRLLLDAVRTAVRVRDSAQLEGRISALEAAVARAPSVPDAPLGASLLADAEKFERGTG